MLPLLLHWTFAILSGGYWWLWAMVGHSQWPLAIQNNFIMFVPVYLGVVLSSFEEVFDKSRELPVFWLALSKMKNQCFCLYSMNISDIKICNVGAERESKNIKLIIFWACQHFQVRRYWQKFFSQVPDNNQTLPEISQSLPQYCQALRQTIIRNC